jgi:hypothetical protein
VGSREELGWLGRQWELAEGRVQRGGDNGGRAERCACAWEEDANFIGG